MNEDQRNKYARQLTVYYISAAVLIAEASFLAFIAVSSINPDDPENGKWALLAQLVVLLTLPRLLTIKPK